MTDVHFIVLICVLGVVGEGLRIRRPGQVFLGPNMLGRYRLMGELLDFTGGTTTPHLLPVIPQGPTYRLSPDFAPAEVTAADHLDLEHTRQIIGPIQSAAGRVIPYCRILLVVLLVLVPFALLTSYLHSRWLVLGAALLVTLPVLLFEFARAFRQLMPDNRGQLVLDLIMKVLFPPAAVFATERFADRFPDRFPDRVAEAGQDKIHPLTAAMILCPEDEGRRLAGFFLRMWRHPVEGVDPERAAEYFKAGQELCAQMGWNAEELTAAPAPDHTDSLTYCPRCLAQYLVSGDECPDCPGVERVAF